MTMTILIVALVVVALLYFMMRGRQAAPASRSATAPRPTPATPAAGLSDTAAFHAVSIKYLTSSCDAAKAMDGKRFLSSAAPRLPLLDCDAETCRCKFVHHKDRRSSEDRRNPFQGPLATSATGIHKIEQRQGGDRRANPPTLP